VTLPAIRDASCRVRISEAADADPMDLSDADFAIGDAIAVTSPAGGETLVIGQAFDIAWSSAGVETVDLELSRDGGGTWEALASAIPAADGTLPWTVAGPASDACLVRIADSADDDPYGQSGSVFAIVEPSDVDGGVDGGADGGADGGTDEGDGGCDCDAAGRRPGRERLASGLVLGAFLPSPRRSP